MTNQSSVIANETGDAPMIAWRSQLPAANHAADQDAASWAERS
jgi:hypothetical protein